MIGSVDWPWQAYCITVSCTSNTDEGRFLLIYVCWFVNMWRFFFSKQKPFGTFSWNADWLISDPIEAHFSGENFRKVLFRLYISIASRNLCDVSLDAFFEATNPSVRRLLLVSCWHGFFATRMTLGGFSIHSDPTCQVLHLDNERWLAPCVAGTGMAMAFASPSGSLIRERCHRNILKLISNRCPWQLHVSTLILASQAFMKCQMQRSIAP